MRLNKTTAVGAIAACAIVGATSPVWAGAGSRDNRQAAQTAATDRALRAEIAKLTAQLQADRAALQAVSRSATAETNALRAARARAARWKAAAASADAAAANARTFDFPANHPGPAFGPAPIPKDQLDPAGRYPCHHARR